MGTLGPCCPACLLPPAPASPIHSCIPRHPSPPPPPPPLLLLSHLSRAGDCAGHEDGRLGQGEVWPQAQEGGGPRVLQVGAGCFHSVCGFHLHRAPRSCLAAWGAALLQPATLPLLLAHGPCAPPCRTPSLPLPLPLPPPCPHPAPTLPPPCPDPFPPLPAASPRLSCHAPTLSQPNAPPALPAVTA